MRQKPIRHIVKTHTRQGKPVRSHTRGSRIPIFTKKRVYVPDYLDVKDTLPGTSIPVRWETMGGPQTTTKVWMKPEEFLSYTTPPDYGAGGFSQSSLKSLTEVLTEKGEEFYSPYLTVRFRDNQVTGHEGRHRAYWAMLQNIPRIPVYIVWDDSTGHFAEKRKTKFGKLKPQGFYEREKLGSRYHTHPFYSALDVAEGVPIPIFPEEPPRIIQKPKPEPKSPSKINMYSDLTPTQRIRLYKLRAKHMCPECGSSQAVRDYAKSGQYVCLSCGKEFKLPKKLKNP